MKNIRIFMTFDSPVEQEIKDYFTQKGITFSDNSSSYDQLDFTILIYLYLMI
jgi:hypothetical protein